MLVDPTPRAFGPWRATTPRCPLVATTLAAPGNLLLLSQVRHVLVGLGQPPPWVPPLRGLGPPHHGPDGPPLRDSALQGVLAAQAGHSESTGPVTHPTHYPDRTGAKNMMDARYTVFVNAYIFMVKSKLSSVG